ncbi:MAG TPA: pyridoxamine 5'-phosphate oxidase family protein [Verrucomicrobiae bacterium]|nr:pyridoxamine 5'-phosphate oxidase family protein [Verrucomicrobiae bacterium]
MNAPEEALSILCAEHEASLGTVEDGKPYVSAVGYVYRPAPEGGLGRLYLLLSDLARHSKNLARSSQASLLILEKKEGVPVHETRRMSLQGKVARVADAAFFASLKKEYLQLFPRSEMFFQLPDFRFYEMTPEEIHWIGGFGKAGTFR